jgi:hypothetical protein
MRALTFEQFFHRAFLTIHNLKKSPKLYVETDSVKMCISKGEHLFNYSIYEHKKIIISSIYTHINRKKKLFHSPPSAVSAGFDLAVT